jgi:hypothetical protein
MDISQVAYVLIGFIFGMVLGQFISLNLRKRGAK